MPVRVLNAKKQAFMRNKNVKIGEIVLIPLTVGFAIGKVLFLSQRYKNVVLLGIYSITVKEETMPLSLPDNVALTVYTSQTVIQQGRWITIGQEELKGNQLGLTKRIVGGEVWIEDEKLHQATPDDINSLPVMDVFGAGLVEKKAGQLIATGASSLRMKRSVLQGGLVNLPPSSSPAMGM